MGKYQPQALKNKIYSCFIAGKTMKETCEIVGCSRDLADKLFRDLEEAHISDTMRRINQVKIIEERLFKAIEKNLKAPNTIQEKYINHLSDTYSKFLCS